MEQSHSVRQFGVGVILLTLLFRLFEVGLPQGALRLLQLDILADKETGRDVRSLRVERDLSFPFLRESSPPMDLPQEPERPAFAPADAEAIELTNSGGKTPDLPVLMTAPLTWELEAEGPTVLIVHTHTSESYTKDGEDYKESAAYRTLEEEHNMLSIGDRVAKRLEEAGIRVIHDREIHDYPSYDRAYAHARKSIQAVMEEYPGIQLLLDLHRDAVQVGSGQMSTHVMVGGSDGAQLMLVLGTGNSGLPSPKWEDNLSLALKLQTVLERSCPGICRPVSLRNQRFNQDLAPFSLLVEVGAAGDTRQRALRAADQLAKAIIALKDGAAE